MSAIAAVAVKVSVYNIDHNIEIGRNSHQCPWLITARHVEQFDYYHQDKKILVKPCCSLRPEKPSDYQLDTREFERSIKKMSQEFEYGRWPKECQVCEKEEQQGMISERLRAFQDNLHTATSIEKVFHFHLKFSNFCNLACRVCTTTESSTYGKIVETLDPSIYMQVDISDHAHWSILLDFLDENIQQKEYFKLCLVGGETTLAPGIVVLDQWLTAKGYVSKIDLVLASNMINIPDRVLDFFARCKSTTIAASLDSTHDNFHYVRWPGTWNKATATVGKVLDYREKNGANINLMVSPNFNINNIFYLDDFLDYWSDHPYDSMIVFNVYAPEVFRVDTLPLYIRPALIENLEKCASHRFFSKKNTNGVKSWLLTTLDRLKDTTDHLPKLWDRYLTVNAEFDYLTNTHMSILNSRLYDLLSIEDRDYYKTAFEGAQTLRVTATPGVVFSDNNPAWQSIPIRKSINAT